MGPNESALEKILNAPDWDAPALLPLEEALGPINRALGDLAQPDSTKWSGAAAEEAANAFKKLHASYRKLEIAVAGVQRVVNQANVARDKARTAFHGLPEPIVPGWVHDSVAAAKAAGEHNVVVKGVAYAAEGFVSIFEGWLGEDREEEAHEALETLRAALIPAHRKLIVHNKAIQEAAGYEFPDPVPGPDPTSSEWEIPDPPVPPVVRPPVPVPGIRPPKPPKNVPSLPGPYPGPQPGNPGPGPGVPTPYQLPKDGVDPWPPRTGGPSPYPYPGDGGGGDTGSGGDYPYVPRPDVDSGSGGTIGSPGLAAGLLGGGALAGGAALRWGSRAGAAGTQGLGPGSAGGPGGAGGLLGSGGPGPGSGAGAGGVAGGRGLAGGLPGGGAGSGAGTGAGAGPGGTSGGTSGGMMAGGGAGAGGGSSKKGQKSGLGGHIAPKLEDDDTFIPQSDSARAGSRDELD